MNDIDTLPVGVVNQFDDNINKSIAMNTNETVEKL